MWTYTKSHYKIETILRTKNFNSLLNIVCNSKFIKHSLFKLRIVLKITIGQLNLTVSVQN